MEWSTHLGGAEPNCGVYHLLFWEGRWEAPRPVRASLKGATDGRTYKGQLLSLNV